MPKNRPTRFAALEELYLSRGLSLRTAAAYARIMIRAQDRADDMNTHLISISSRELSHLAGSFPRSRSSQMQLRAAIAHWWAYLERTDGPLWAIRPPRKPRMRCKALTEPQASRIEAEARLRGDRPGLAALFALYAGLRAHEIAKIRWQEIRSDGWLWVVGKGDVSAELPLHPVLAQALAELRSEGEPEEFVFPGRGRECVSTQTVWNWVGIVSVAAGVGRISPHILRHTCLATANDLTGDLRAVQELARHARPETTAGYTRVSGRRLQSVAFAIDYSRAAERVAS